MKKEQRRKNRGRNKSLPYITRRFLCSLSVTSEQQLRVNRSRVFLLGSCQFLQPFIDGQDVYFPALTGLLARLV